MALSINHASFRDDIRTSDIRMNGSRQPGDNAANGRDGLTAGRRNADAKEKTNAWEKADGRMLPGKDKAEDKKGRYGLKDPTQECETCKKRKYQDGSNEMVSFKSPQHVSPTNAGAAVRAHEQEHVSNAYKKAAMDNGKVVFAAVSIHMGICPECGRTYVSGGTTHTQIKYYNEDNPYQKDLKSADRNKYVGRNLNYAT